MYGNMFPGVQLTHIMLCFVVISPDKIILWEAQKIELDSLTLLTTLSLHSGEGNSHDKKLDGVYINILSFYPFHSEFGYFSRV